MVDIIKAQAVKVACYPLNGRIGDLLVKPSRAEVARALWLLVVRKVEFI